MAEDDQQQQQQYQNPEMVEEQLQNLRSKATDLLLRKEWSESIQIYTQFISLCQNHISKTHLPNLHKSLCLAFSNRAEARSNLRDFDKALDDCDQALKIESTHFKTLLCRGKILLGLNRYSMALECFKAAGNSETLNEYLEKCKKLEFQARTGAFDLSDWVLNGFRGKSPELAEYIGAVQIKKSEISGRGLFATKNIDAGTLVLVTKAIASERSILPGKDLGENAQMVMWKNFIDKVVKTALKSQRTHHLISTLSSGEDEEELEVPHMNIFRPEAEEISYSNGKNLDMSKILTILDVNSLVEDAISSKVLGKISDCYGVGLWILASFINHSCNPNARRLHVGDHVIVHVSRDVKAGEEITFAYFDVFSGLEKRTEMSRTWGFHCRCNRCKFEEGMFSRQEMREIEMGFERGMDVGGVIYRLEEGLRRWNVRGKEKGFLRASFWAAYFEAYRCEKWLRRWGRRIPAVEVVVDSVVEAVGNDERVLKVVVEGLKKSDGGGGGCGGGGMVEMERALKMGRGIYGKVVKKQAMKTLLELGFHD